MSEKYVLTIDQSTSQTKAMLFSEKGALMDRVDVKHRQITNEKGFVEHDADEIYKNTILAVKKLVDRNADKKDGIMCVGITNQRETAVCFDVKTGMPVYNAIVWQDGRAKDVTDKLSNKKPYFKNATGLNLSPYFSAPKYAWIINNVEKARELAKSGDLRCSNVDSWLLYKLTGEYKTDFTNASRTLLFNLDKLSYDETALQAFGLKKEFLAKPCPSDELFGYTDFEGIFDRKLPISAVMGDSHAALFANSEKVGAVKATFGTGTSLMQNVGTRRMENVPVSLVESVAFSFGGKAFYCVEGNINYSGALMQRLVEMGFAENVAEISNLAKTVDGNGGVYFVPAFSGLSAPYWDENARAVLCGMSASTTKAHICRAAEEAIAFQIEDVFAEMEKNGKSAEYIYADGGATKDKLLMRLVADLTDKEVYVSSIEELSAFGVAKLAIRSAEFGKNNEYSVVSPKKEKEERTRLLSGWQEAVGKALTNKQ